ncbi:trehalose-phosphatase [Novosphingobium sp. ZN18A2]|uniref:trehalose-phosphatase n=1 Tax=Novosphingobium sp. ZN18A2 TaxID=3079861 RepID=UPI0030CCBFEB
MLQLDMTGQKAPPPAGLLEGATLLLDFDGTMVELAPRPDAVLVDDRLRRLVTALGDRLDRRIAFISGRDAATLKALLGLDGIAIAGSHGLEILHASGKVDRPVRPASLDTAVKRMRAFADAHPGVLVEDKPLGAALHYRLAPQDEAASNRLAQQLAADTGLALQTGKKMVELRLGSGDKGMAVERLMADPGMVGTIPVFAGDDDTDEPGFLAARRLDGHGVLVGPERQSAARFRLPGVDAVRDWLESELAR